MSRCGKRLTLLLLVVALACLAGSLVLSVFARRWGVSDWVSFTVMSGYVLFMLAFLLCFVGTEPYEPFAAEGPPEGGGAEDEVANEAATGRSGGEVAAEADARRAGAQDSKGAAVDT